MLNLGFLKEALLGGVHFTRAVAGFVGTLAVRAPRLLVALLVVAATTLQAVA